MTTLSFSVLIDASVKSVFDFHRNFSNVRGVTPRWMKIRILSAPPVLNEGDELSVLCTVAGISIYWDVKAVTVQPDSLIIDIQSARGPFAYWKHEHHMKDVSGGTLLTDTITYALPFGIIGRMMDALIVKSVQKLLFRYRHKRMRELFTQS